jgi:SAM-dependent methyltransferase
MLKAAAQTLLGETSRYRLRQMLRTMVAAPRRQGSGASEECLSFTCNICGEKCRERLSTIHSDGSSCPGCGSSSRFRAVIYGLSVGLFGKSLLLQDFPADKRVRGAGMTDWVGYACRLTSKFDYTNTYYHKSPLLDIASRSTLPPDRYDFVLSSDVMEHVRPPVSAALANVLTILKPGGLFVVTVPCYDDERTREHFPDLHDYEVIKFRGELLLLNRTAAGRYQVFDDLVFHGGPGDALELRCFSPTGLAEEMRAAGFVDVRIPNEDPSVGFVHSTPPQGVLVIGRNRA